MSLLSANSCLASEKLSSFHRNKPDITLLPVDFCLSAQPLGCVIFSFHTTFSGINYLCILCTCFVIRFVWQRITQISCCYADLNPCWSVISHPKTHDLLCICHEVQLSDEHPSSHECELAKWLHLISADRSIYWSTIIPVWVSFGSLNTVRTNVFPPLEDMLMIGDIKLWWWSVSPRTELHAAQLLTQQAHGRWP